MCASVVLVVNVLYNIQIAGSEFKTMYTVTAYFSTLSDSPYSLITHTLRP